ncbi:unnamed protein product [Sphagnum balticum]
MRKTWVLLLGFWGRQRGRGRGEDADEPGGYGLSRTDAERGSSGAVDDSQCGTPDDPKHPPPAPEAFVYFFYSEVVEGPKVLCFG